MLQVYVERAKGLSKELDVEPGPKEEKDVTDAMVDAMRKALLLAVSVPKELGGPGLDVAGIAQITYEIARQSGSAGLIYAMHISQAYSLTTHAEGEFFAALQQRMLEEQLLIASGTSEKGPGGNILTSLCDIEEPEGAPMKIVKESPNISYIDHADLILVTANRINGKRKKQVLVAADVDASKFEPGRETGFLGMQGIYNRPFKFTVEFEEEAIFSGDFGAIARRTMTPSIQIFWAALWSGIAWSAIEKAKRFVSKEVAPDSDVTQVVNYELTRIVDLHHSMNALIRSAIAAYEGREQAQDMGFGLSAEINRVKVNCSELLLQICTRSMSLIGVRAYATGGPYSLTREISDALSAPVMVSNFRLAMNTAKIERFVDETLF